MKCSVFLRLVLYSLMVLDQAFLSSVICRHDIPDGIYCSLASRFEFSGICHISTTVGKTTGSLIDSRTVLTAAHGLQNGELATVTFLDPVTKRELTVTGIAIVHPKYLRQKNGKGFIEKVQADLALIKLKKPILHIPSIMLSFESGSIGDETLTIGFGKCGTGLTGSQKRSIKKEKKGFSNRIKDQCSLKLDDVFDILAFRSPCEQLITPAEGIGVEGDSGSPVFLRKSGMWQAYGITSLLHGEGKYGSLNAILPIQKYLGWIRSTYSIKRAAFQGGICDWHCSSTWGQISVPQNNSRKFSFFSALVDHPGLLAITKPTFVDAITIHHPSVTVRVANDISFYTTKMLLQSGYLHLLGEICGHIEMEGGTFIGQGRLKTPFRSCHPFPTFWQKGGILEIPEKGLCIDGNYVLEEMGTLTLLENKSTLKINGNAILKGELHILHPIEKGLEKHILTASIIDNQLTRVVYQGHPLALSSLRTKGHFLYLTL